VNRGLPGLDLARGRDRRRYWGRSIRKVIEGGGGGGKEGNFQLARIFSLLTACAGIFFSGETLCMNFFGDKCFFFLSEILIHYLFCAS